MKGVSNEMGNFLYDVIILGVTMTPAWGASARAMLQMRRFLLSLEPAVAF